MSARIIDILVENEYMKGADVAVGAAGSHDDVVLRMEFGSMWEGTTKSIVWKNSRGLNPVITILTADMLEEGLSNVYLVRIPAEPKEFPGEMIMSVKGAKVNGSVETSATLTAFAKFTVLESFWDDDAESSQDVTATQAEQLQHQIDVVLDDLVDVLANIESVRTSAQAAADSASAAAISAQNAASSEGNALSYKNEALGYAGNAASSATYSESYAVGGTGTRTGENTDNAKYYYEQSADCMDGAQQAASDSEGSAEDAEAWAIGKRSGQDVPPSDETHQNNSKYYSEQSAASAASIGVYEHDAEAWAVGKRGGTDVPSSDETYHNNSKYYSDEAASDSADAQTASASAQASASAAHGSELSAAADAILSKSYAVGGTGTRAGEDTDNAEYYKNEAARIVAEAGVGDMLKSDYDPLNRAEPVAFAADLNNVDNTADADKRVAYAAAAGNASTADQATSAGSASTANYATSAGNADTADYATSAGNAGTVNSHTVEEDVPSGAVFTDTTYGVVSKTANGLAPALPNETATTKYLRQDGTWQVPPDTTYSSQAAASGGTAVSLVTTGEKYTWNSKANGTHNHAAGDINSGTLGVARGGTGAGSFTANCAIVSNTTTTGALTTRAITNNTATSTNLAANTNLITQNTLRFHTNRLTSAATADTSYTTYMFRGAGLFNAAQTGMVNGAIAWVYK